MEKLLPDGRSYQNRLPGTVTVRSITCTITKPDYSSWRRYGQWSRICRRSGAPHGMGPRQDCGALFPLIFSDQAVEFAQPSLSQRPMTPAVSGMEPQLPFVGMARELERLSLAFATGDSLLLLGPQGSGKTRLIREALSRNPQVRYIAWEPTLHALLESMARALLADPEDWRSAQTSLHLKGRLWTAIESSPTPLVLDGVDGAGFPTYRFLQRIYHAPGMALFAASRDASRLGALARLFWNASNVLPIPPLDGRDAEKLFEAAADRFQLRHLDLDEFRDKVLETARGNPGQIVEMCRLAAQPQYHSGRYIKFAPLRIDTVMKFTAHR